MLLIKSQSHLQWNVFFKRAQPGGVFKEEGPSTNEKMSIAPQPIVKKFESHAISHVGI